jgi:hypothetical protein
MGGRLHVFMTRHIYTHINKPVFSTLLQTLRATLPYSPLKIKCISTGIQVHEALHCIKIRLHSTCLTLKFVGFSLSRPWCPVSNSDCQKVVTRLRYVLRGPPPPALYGLSSQALSIPLEPALAAIPSPPP